MTYNLAQLPLQCLYIFLIIFTSSISFAQLDHNKTIDLKTFDTELLTELIHYHINLTRDTLDQTPLTFDTKLKASAQLQADFCIKINKLSHSHKKAKYHNLRNRIDHVDGVHQTIGENLISRDLSKKSDITTYNDLAIDFVDRWIKSKGHFKNLKSSQFDNSGIAIAYNKKTQKVVAAQVFGSRPIEFEGYTSPAKAYGLTNGHTKECKPCRKAIDTLYIGAVANGNKVYVSVMNLDYFKKAFQGKYYFTADIILREQFACGQKNTLHSSPYHDGYLLKPVSKQKLLKNNLGGEADLYAEIGELPFGIEGDYETNLIITRAKPFSKKKPICVSIIPSPGYGSDLNIMPPTIKVDTSDDKSSFVKTKKMKFVIPFEKDKYKYTQEDIQPLIDSLKLNEFNITEIKLFAFASVEGEKGRNLTLQHKRAESILNTFQSFQFDTIKTSVKTRENWKEFNRAIKRSKYKSFLELSHADIKQALKTDSIINDLEPLLAKHRKAIIYISTVEKIDNQASTDELLQQYKTLLSDSTSSIDSTSAVQKKLFADIIRYNISTTILDNISIPEKASHTTIINNHIALQYKIDSIVPAFYQLQIYDSLSQKHPELLSNIYGFMIQHWYDNPYLVINYKKLLAGIKKIHQRKKISDGEYYKLMVNYHIALANLYRKEQQYENEHKATKYVLNYYKRASLSPKDALILANFLVYHSMAWDAAKLLHPYANAHDVSEDLFFYYLSLTIHASKKTEQADFEHKMALALEMNQTRFCQLFGYPALTFQLMRRDNLKTLFCESCNETENIPDIKSIIGNDDMQPKLIITSP